MALIYCNIQHNNKILYLELEIKLNLILLAKINKPNNYKVSMEKMKAKKNLNGIYIYKYIKKRALYILI